MDLKEIDHDDAQNRGQWRALVNMVMSFRVTGNVGNVLSSWANISFWERTQLCGVNILKRSESNVVGNSAASIFTSSWRRKQQGHSKR